MELILLNRITVPDGGNPCRRAKGLVGQTTPQLHGVAQAGDLEREIFRVAWKFS